MSRWEGEWHLPHGRSPPNLNSSRREGKIFPHGTIVEAIRLWQAICPRMPFAIEFGTNAWMDWLVMDVGGDQIRSTLSISSTDRRKPSPGVGKSGMHTIDGEDWRSYGVGAEIAATIQEEAFDYLDAPVKRVASVEVPLPYSKPLELSALTGAEQLEQAIHELAIRRRRRPWLK